MLRLIKTSNGSNGSPTACNSCGSVHFIKAGIAWHCADCGVYFPTKFTTPGSDLGIKTNFDKLITTQKELREAIKNLEILVRE